MLPKQFSLWLFLCWNICTTTAQTLEVNPEYRDNPASATFVDGMYVAFNDSVARVWDIKSGRIRQFEKAKSKISRVELSPKGKYLLVATDPYEDNVTTLWEVKTGKKLHVFPMIDYGAGNVAFSADNRYVLVGWSGLMSLWDIKKKQEVKKYHFTDREKGASMPVFSPDRRYLAMANPFAGLWDVETGKKLKTFKQYDIGSPGSLAFSPDGRYLLVGNGLEQVHGMKMDAGKVLTLWEVKTGKRIRNFVGHQRTIYGLAFSANGHYAVSGSSDHTVRLWNLKTGKLIRLFNGHQGWVTKVAFSPDNCYIYTCSSGNSVKLWSIKTGKLLLTLVATFKNPKAWVMYTPDGRYEGNKEGLKKLYYTKGTKTYALPQNDPNHVKGLLETILKN